MTTVTIGVSSMEDTKARMRRAFEGEEQGAFIGFPSVELLWRVLTPRRWETLRVMAGAGPLAIRKVEGDHFTILYEPYVKMLGESLAAIIPATLQELGFADSSEVSNSRGA